MCKTCKECPWVVRNQFNDMIIKHSKKYDKSHNCHMIPQDKRGDLWTQKKKQNVWEENNTKKDVSHMFQ